MGSMITKDQKKKTKLLNKIVVVIFECCLVVHRDHSPINWVTWIIWTTTSENVPSDMWASGDSDQPALSHSLIQIVTGRVLGIKESSFLMRITKILIRLRGLAGWFESSLGVYVWMYVSSCWASLVQVYISKHSTHDITLNVILTTVFSLRIRQGKPE